MNPNSPRLAWLAGLALSTSLAGCGLDFNEAKAPDTSTKPSDPEPAPKTAPLIEQLADSLLIAGNELVLTPKLTDADGQIVSIQWQQIAGQPLTLSATDKAELTLTSAAVLDAFSATLKLTVTDNDNLSSSKQVLINVNPRHPDPQAFVGPDRSGIVAQSFSAPQSFEILFVDGTASSGLGFQWQVIKSPAGSQFGLTSAQSPSVGFFADKAGSYELQLTTDNGQGKTATDSLIINLIEDVDGDGIANTDDLDRDGDGFLNTNDAFPDLKAAHLDSDKNGTSNFAQADEDGDGVVDIEDAFPFDASQTTYSLYTEQKEPASFNANDGVTVSENAGTAPLQIQGGINSKNAAPDLDYFRVHLTPGIYSLVLNQDSEQFNSSVNLITAQGVALAANPLQNSLSAKVSGISVQVIDEADYYLIVTDRAGRSDPSWTYRIQLFADQDMDGISDALEMAIDSNHLSADSDGDGISDFVEINLALSDWAKWVDSDNDGLPLWWDFDSDNDGVFDSQEFFSVANRPDASKEQLAKLNDVDNDGIPNFLDTDSDGNGISDKDEAGINPRQPKDTDGDTTPDWLDTDNDNDGLLDSQEQANSLNEPLNKPGAKGKPLADSLLIQSINNADLALEAVCKAGTKLDIAVRNAPASGLQVLFNTLDGALVVPVTASSGRVQVACPEQIAAGVIEVFLATATERTDGYALEILAANTPLITSLQYQHQNRKLTLIGSNLAKELTLYFAPNLTQVVNNQTGSAEQLTLSLPAGVSSGYLRAMSIDGSSNKLWLELSRSISGQIQSPNAQVAVTSLDLSLFEADPIHPDAAGKFTSSAREDAASVLTAFIEYPDSTEDKPHYATYLSAVSLPGEAQAVLSADSTALALIWDALGVNALLPVEDWSLARDTLAALPEVKALATAIHSALSADAFALGAPSASLSQTTATAIVAAAQRLSIGLQAPKAKPVVAYGKFGDDAKVTPTEVDDISVYERGDTGHINVENDTQLYLSAKITTTDGKVLQDHITGLDGMAGPQGYGLLFWAKASEFNHPDGKNVVVEIISAGIDREFDPKQHAPFDVWSKLFVRTWIERVIWPVLSYALPGDASDLAKIIYGAAPNLVDIVTTKALQGDAKGSLVALVDLVWEDFASLPPGPITTALATKYGKNIGEKILAKIAAKIGAKFVPGIGQIALAAEIAGHINNGAGVAKAIVDVGSTDSLLHFNVEFPLNIEEAVPSKIKADDTNRQVTIKGSGFAPIKRGFWPFDSTLKPAVTFTDADGIKFHAYDVNSNADGTELSVELPGWYLSKNIKGPIDVEIHHPTDFADAKADKADAISIIGQVELSSISPAQGGVAISATVYGAGFSKVLVENELTVGGMRALITGASESHLQILIPAGLQTGTYPVVARVQTDGDWSDWSNSIDYEVVDAKVSVRVCDNGSAKDDAFALYVNGLYQGTMYASRADYCDDYPVNLQPGQHNAMLLGIEAPDSVGTYSISFSGVTGLSGSATSGSDLVPGVRKFYNFNVPTQSNAEARAKPPMQAAPIPILVEEIPE